MTPSRFAQAEEIFHTACALADDHDRGRILDAECGDDTELRTLVEDLLRSDAEAVDPIDPEEVRDQLEALLHEQEEATEDASSAGVPDRIGPYRIIRCIAVGGMATVYEAEQPRPRRIVALKTLHRGAASPRIMRRFLQEVELLGRLRHPGIAHIIEAGWCDLGDGERPFFAMEYVDGENLLEHARQHQLGVRDRLLLFAAVCEAVHSAHQAGVVHRDLKPQNIFIEKTTTRASGTPGEAGAGLGQPKVLDFGVARATQAHLELASEHTEVGQLVGTLPYMSPEQIAGDSSTIDVRSDVYALGVLLFELLSGQLPHDVTGRTVPEAVRILRETEPRSLRAVDRRFHGDLDTIAAKALASEPGQRYPGAAELAEDVQRFLRDEPIRARPASTRYRLAKLARRNRALVGAMAATLLILAIGSSVTLMFALKSLHHREEATRANYRTSIEGTISALDRGDMRAAKRHLDHVPSARRGGWEWGYLQTRLDPVRAVYALEGAPVASSRCAFDRQGRALLAVVRDGAVALRDMESGDTLGVFGAGTRPSLPAVSPDGRWLAAFGLDDREVHAVWVWDTQSPSAAWRTALPPGSPLALRFDGTGETIAIVTTDEVRVIEPRTGLVHCRHRSSVGQCRDAVFGGGGGGGGGGATIAVLDGSTLFVHDTSSGRVLAHREVGPGTADALAISPDGSSLALGTFTAGSYVQLFEMNGIEDQAEVLGDSNPVRGVAWSPDSRHFARASTEAVIIDDIAGESAPTSFLIEPEGSGPVWMAFSADRTRLAIAGSELAQLVDLKAEPALVLAGHEASVADLVFSSDGTMLASRDLDGRVRWWDVLTGEAILEDAGRGPQILAWDSDGCRRGPAGPTDWRSRPPTSPFPPRPAGSERTARSVRGGGAVSNRGGPVAFGPDGQVLADGTVKGTITVRDPATGAVRRRIDGHAAPITALAVSPDGRRLVSGGGPQDPTVRVWDLVDGACLATMKGHTDRVNSIAFSPDGTRILSGGNDRTARLWDAETYEPLVELRGHTRHVWSAVFSPDGSQIATASGDSTVRLWDSLSRKHRRTQARADASRRNEVRPIVAALLLELGDPQLVAQHLGEQRDLDGEDHRAALRVLIEMADEPQLSARSHLSTPIPR